MFSYIFLTVQDGPQTIPRTPTAAPSAAASASTPAAAISFTLTIALALPVSLVQIRFPSLQRRSGISGRVHLRLACFVRIRGCLGCLQCLQELRPLAILLLGPLRRSRGLAVRLGLLLLRLRGG